MSDFKPQSEAGQAEAGHEGTDLSLRPIIGFVIALIVMAVFVYAVLGLFMNQFVKESNQEQALKPALFADDRGQFPSPNNQVAPRVELSEHRRRERAQLDTYGWVDQKKGIARVPIDRALDILAERGLPKVKNIAPKGARGVATP